MKYFLAKKTIVQASNLVVDLLLQDNVGKICTKIR